MPSINRGSFIIVAVLAVRIDSYMAAHFFSFRSSQADCAQSQAESSNICIAVAFANILLLEYISEKNYVIVKRGIKVLFI